MKKLLIFTCIIIGSAQAGPLPSIITYSQASQNDPTAGGVQPLDTKVPQWSTVNAMIQSLIEQGYTTLQSKTPSNLSVVDNKLSDYRKNIPNNDLAALQNATFTANFNTIAKAIQQGAFEQLTYNRLLISEYLLGRVVLCATALKDTPFMNSFYSRNLFNNTTSYQNADNNYKNIINNFITTGQSYLQQTRYLRNAFTPHSSNAALSSYGNDAIHYLSPADTFAGLILINKTSKDAPFIIGSSSNQIPSGKIGFYAASGSANNWTAESDDNAWGKKRTVSFSIEGAGKGEIALYQNQNNLPKISVYASPNQQAQLTIPVNFDQNTLQKFFATPHPWALVVRTTNAQPIEVIGLAKISTYSFPSIMPFAGKKDSYPDFSLGEILKAPESLYKLTLSNANPQAGEAYPFANWVLQGLFNGHLQSSFYKPIVNPSYGQIQWRQKWATPTAAQWFENGSSLDWKFLRALLVTRSAQKIMYINNLSMNSIEDILANPTSSNNAVWYIGATDKYIPVVPAIKQR